MASVNVKNLETKGKKSADFIIIFQPHKKLYLIKFTHFDMQI
jgi:hypothetical protein